MKMYAGLDASDKTTHICVFNSDGAVLRRDVVASDPDVLAKWFGRNCTGLVQVVLDTGPLSTFLYHGLKEREVPVDCICARHAKGVLATRVNKSDVHDAQGFAQLARTGWFSRAHAQTLKRGLGPARASDGRRRSPVERLGNGSMILHRLTKNLKEQC